MKKLWVLMAVLCILGLTGCDKGEQQIDLYTINEAQVQEYQGTKDFLIAAVEERCDVTLKTTSDVTRGHQIYLIQDTAYAETIGYKLSALDHDFVIKNIQCSIYILASSDGAMNRATSYFVRNLIDESGNVTLQNGETCVGNSTLLKKEVLIGETPVEEYTITYSADEELEACREMRYYIQQTGGACLDIRPASKADGNVIALGVDENLAAGEKKISVTDSQVSIAAADVSTLEDAVHLFVNTYLGWMYAGQPEQRISSVDSTICVPDTVEQQEAWIEEREAIIVLWNINYNRGFDLNTDTTLENNIMDYSEEQLYEYVKMLKYCGFTGIQMTEMCSAWAGVGGYEAAHEKMRMMADAAHSLDMNVTLWVWGAEFNGYGWVDESVVYYEEGCDYSKDSEEVVAVFEKYYSIYAQMADCVDRVIGHFYDPGNLHTAEDIAYFSKMLKEKFHAVNPEIDFGISCWVDIYDKGVFVRELGTDITLYECGHHDNVGDYETFRKWVANSGCRMGTWAWNTCEMEIDQLAQMHFNMDIIRSVYQTARNYDSICKPSYWSEMDSYHVLNVFSLYCAGQMLINPDIESDELYQGIAEAAVGSEYAYDFREILSLIQDARSGSSWDTYFWSREDYILKSDNYPAESILERCNTYIPVLEEMIEKGVESNSLPLPVSMTQLLQMMRPHLEQIRDYAKFRIAFAELEEQYAQGVDAETLGAKLYEIGNPIDSYNCIVGTWGQVEARAQREMILEFCNNTGVELPIYEELDKQRKDFIYSHLTMYQRGKSEPIYTAAPYYQFGLAFTQQETERLVNEMVEDGLLMKTESGEIYLTNWENYKYHFN